MIVVYAAVGVFLGRVIVVSGCVIAVVFGLLRAASRAGDEIERRFQEETMQWAAEIEEVPRDWLDALDSIKRLPEKMP